LKRGAARAADGRAATDRAAAAAELHRLADRARFLYGADRLPTAGQAEFTAGCRAFWNDRDRIVDRLRTTGTAVLDPAVRADLIDLAICCANAEANGLGVLDQAEAIVGPSPVLELERRLRGAPAANGTPPPAKTAWEHYALGRALLRTGDLERAAAETDEAVRLEPQSLWPNYYQGVCAYRRGQFADAAAAFGVCIGAAPDAAGCYVNRALAFAALGRTEAALRDYDRSLRLDATLTSPVLESLPRRRPQPAP
jgi:tetratricopeptide (TPR) repeat protein